MIQNLVISVPTNALVTKGLDHQQTLVIVSCLCVQKSLSEKRHTNLHHGNDILTEDAE